jgi:NADH-quinone oxidoreductase subunit A
MTYPAAVLLFGEPSLQNNYAYIALFATIGVAFTVATMWFSWVIRPTHRRTGIKSEPYECGELPIGNAWRQFKAGYYIFALLFVVFDVEVAFIFPWARVLRDMKSAGMGMFAFLEMMVFIAILFVGLIYAWRKGVLKWD